MTWDPTTDAVVQEAQDRVAVADELVEAAAGLVAEAADREDWTDVVQCVRTYRRAKAQRRYAWAVYETVRRGRQASA